MSDGDQSRELPEGEVNDEFDAEIEEEIRRRRQVPDGLRYVAGLGLCALSLIPLAIIVGMLRNGESGLMTTFVVMFASLAGSGLLILNSRSWAGFGAAVVIGGAMFVVTFGMCASGLGGGY